MGAHELHLGFLKDSFPTLAGSEDLLGLGANALKDLLQAGWKDFLGEITSSNSEGTKLFSTAVADGALRFAKGASSNALCKQLARAAAVGEARFGDRVRGVDLGRGDARLRALGYDQQPPQSGFYDAVVLAGSVAEVSTKDGANF